MILPLKNPQNVRLYIPDFLMFAQLRTCCWDTQGIGSTSGTHVIVQIYEAQEISEMHLYIYCNFVCPYQINILRWLINACVLMHIINWTIDERMKIGCWFWNLYFWIYVFWQHFFIIISLRSFHIIFCYQMLYLLYHRDETFGMKCRFKIHI